jgi:hypothetical protein
MSAHLTTAVPAHYASVRHFDIRRWSARFWGWWIGLYAAPPRRLRPMI